MQQTSSGNFDKWTSAGYLANHLARLFAIRLSARIMPLGLNTGQFPILLELWDSDGLTQKDIVERTNLEQATVANTLARMERDGLVERRPHETDRRAQCVFLTARGRELEAPAKRAALDVNAAALVALSDDERKVFVSLLGRVVSAMSAERPRGRRGASRSPAQRDAADGGR